MNRYTRVVRPAPKPQTPIEALHLAEDMERLKMAIECVTRLSPINICDSWENGEMQIRLWLVNLRRSYNYAQDKLRREYL